MSLLRPALQRPLLDWATIALLALGLLAPAVDECLRRDSARDTLRAERRPPEPRPRLPRSLRALADFPRRYEAFFGDTFGLRDVLLRWNSIEQWLWLGVSPSDLMEPAADGWCFLRRDSRAAHRGLLPFRAEELDDWVRRLCERRDLLAARGIRYLFVICPNKETIYPERAPASWRPLGPTRLEQLARRLESEPDAPFLDLRPALRAERARDRHGDWVYTRSGTHWNGRGAYAAQRAIVERLQRDFPELECVPRERCREVAAQDTSESLASQLYVDDLVPQFRYGLEPSERRYQILLSSTHRSGAKLVTKKDVDAPRLLWLHDSFGPYLDELLCESFAFVQAHWTDEFPLDALREAEPDVVLETYVERVLQSEEPYRSLDLGVAPAELFASFTDVAWRAHGDFGLARPPGTAEPIATAQTLETVRPFGTATLAHGESGLRLVLNGRRDGLLLPPLELAPGSLALLRVEADCPVPTGIEVFVRPAGSANFPRTKHARAELGPQAPAAVLRLPTVGPRFEVLLRYEAPAEGLNLRALELRRGPAQGH